MRVSSRSASVLDQAKTASLRPWTHLWSVNQTHMTQSGVAALTVLFASKCFSVVGRLVSALSTQCMRRPRQSNIQGFDMVVITTTAIAVRLRRVAPVLAQPPATMRTGSLEKAHRVGESKLATDKARKPPRQLGKREGGRPSTYLTTTKRANP